MSYIASLNLLNADSPLPLSDESLTEELALWANAQFTFDIAPGSALLDDQLDKKPNNEEQPIQNLDNVAYFADSVSKKPLANTMATMLETLASPYLSSDYLITQIQSSNGQSAINLPRIAPATQNMVLSSFMIPKPTTTSASSNIGKKRKSTSNDTVDSNEKLAAEEDKRRRNTAASARFRMKKKLREQALEKTAKDMTDKVQNLEKQIQELEMEAKWLRALIVEKDPKLLDSFDKQSTCSEINPKDN
ncbi:uncharacterized protein BYT42DRAFT_618794 [Radiomyces spectabilis]|uniref:uncharacterized protein n=1 Tax=Radiomyces spectabilis TaxID=64574 RepID=UPI00221E8FC3|nr:uncharacterized protein BYT42DRAFT_618794 [Radiomyces spectabilis]KAI8364635.1 hypothetical protein BYT42DRAFT_618794 [Radiomyces spectabilis]